MILSAGFLVKDNGGSTDEMIALSDYMLFGSFVQIGLSQFCRELRK